jgi:hypothetical protein
MVGITHIQRGNRRGARTLLSRGAERIAPYRSAAPYRIDVSGLIAHASALVAALDTGADIGPARLRPRLVDTNC